MNKHEIKDLIYKHFEPKDVGIGVLNCIHEDKDVDKLAENLVNLFSIPVVVQQSELLLCKHCDNKKALHSEATGLCPDRFKHFEAK